MSVDDTLELDTVVEESVDALDPISNIDSPLSIKKEYGHIQVS